MEARPRTRLLFDEDVSSRVAKALYELGFHAFHVGASGQPQKQTSDGDVIDHAVRCKQTVVTSNHDMIMLCAERGVSVVWLDPHRTHLLIDEQAVMAFEGVRKWCAALDSASDPVCIRVLRTKMHVLPVAEGAELAAKRYRARRKREAARPRPPKPSTGGQMSTDDANA